VVYHHEKLYAPSDYKDESNFLKTLDSEVQKKRLKESVKDIENDKANSQEVIPENKNNIVIPRQKELTQTYFLAEELALRQLEIELNTVIKRQSGLKIGRELLAFDGVGTDGDNLVIVEIKYTRTGVISIDSLRKFYIHCLKLRNYYYAKQNIVCIIAIVHEGRIFDISDKVREIFDDSISPKVFYYNINELKSKFGIE